MRARLAGFVGAASADIGLLFLVLGLTPLRSVHAAELRFGLMAR